MSRKIAVLLMAALAAMLAAGVASSTTTVQVKIQSGTSAKIKVGRPAAIGFGPRVLQDDGNGGTVEPIVPLKAMAIVPKPLRVIKVIWKGGTRASNAGAKMRRVGNHYYWNIPHYSWRMILIVVKAGHPYKHLCLKTSATSEAVTKTRTMCFRVVR